jgi:hypothetical protein
MSPVSFVTTTLHASNATAVSRSESFPAAAYRGAGTARAVDELGDVAADEFFFLAAEEKEFRRRHFCDARADLHEPVLRPALGKVARARNETDDHRIRPEREAREL